MIVVFTFTLISQYKYANIQESDLTVVKEVFASSKKVKNRYTITCESGNKYSLTYILADDEHVECLNQGASLVLSLDGNRIIKLEANGQTIISVDDCNLRYTKQYKISLIVCISTLVGMILLMIGINILLKKLESNYRCNYNVSDVDINKTIDEKVYKSIQDSIYQKNGYLRCNILEQIESDELVYTFYKAMIDYLSDKEFLLLIDDGCLDDGLAMVFYKDNDKLYFEMIFRDEKEPFEIEKTLFWYYPYNSKVTKEEQKAFNIAVEEYIKSNGDLLVYKNH